MNTIWLFVGPSGVGKTTLLKYLSSKNVVQEIVSVTTRKPRPSEVEGKDYKFVTHSKFLKLKKQHKFVETIQIGEEFYGILFADVLLKLHKTDVGIVMEPNGIRQVKYKFNSQVKTIFLKELDQALLDSRMIERGDSLESILNRRSLDTAIADFESRADYILEADSIENLADKFKEIQRNNFRKQTNGKN